MNASILFYSLFISTLLPRCHCGNTPLESSNSSEKGPLAIHFNYIKCSLSGINSEGMGKGCIETNSDPEQIPVIMELSDINEDYFQVEDCATKTTYSELIRPLKRVRISMVVYHNEVLWKEHDGIKCTSVQVHSDERKTLVVFGFKRGKEQAYRGLIKRGDKDREEINVESINETIFDTTDELNGEDVRVNNNGKAGLFDKIVAFVNHYLRYNSGIPEVNRMAIKGHFGIKELGKEVVRRSNGAITHLRNTRGSQHGGTFYNKYFQVACPTFRLLRRLFRR